MGVTGKLRRNRDKGEIWLKHFPFPEEKSVSPNSIVKEVEDEQEIKPGMMITIVLDNDNVVQKLNFDDKLIIENSVPFQIEDADLHKDMTLTGYFINSEEKVTLTVSKTATL